jgi:hypothetical protein
MMMDSNGPVAFNVHAELYENDFGELAIRFEGERVYRGMGDEESARFQYDAKKVIEERQVPPGWQEMPAHELLYGRGWHHVGSMGYLDGDVDKPALELEIEPGRLGENARRYLADAILH